MRDLIDLRFITPLQTNSKRIIDFLKWNPQISLFLKSKGMIMALSKALVRQITLSMPYESEACPNTIVVTEVEIDHFKFHMEFHTILQ